MNNTIQIQLFALFDRQQRLWQKHNSSSLVQRSDPDWPSPCQVGEALNEYIQWKPIKRQPREDMNNIEDALEIQLHPSIVDFFCSTYADSIPCLYNEHPIDLIQVWNEEDFELLQENMIAHFLMQKKLKQPASMFIASCTDDMQIVSILNETGQVQLETLGKGQERILAENLAEFLADLQPVISK